MPKLSAQPPSDLNPRTDAALDFPVRELGEMSPRDYDELGFMCGLEIHQQLLTERKLFCRCPGGVRTRAVDAEILRHMRPTLSELGEYDGTALMEFKTKKEIIYQLARGSVCTYEIDDTPPFPINRDAVSVAIEISRLFDLSLVAELHIMRKQYLDGSIPTGFQRTAMVGLAGEIPFPDSELGSDRMLRIRQLSLEEDSCREVSDIGHTIVFRTDRLGMPLVETVTEPDLLTPRDVMVGAGLLARVARASGKVRRGAGAARQDVNVSIAGGRRVEIKGVSSHRMLPRLVHIEAFRQLELLRIKHDLERRGLTREMLPDPAPATLPWKSSDLVVNAAPVLRKSAFDPIAEAIARGDAVCAVRLPLFRDLLSHRAQPLMTFAHELRDRVRVIACLVGRPNMLHSDVLDLGIEGSKWNQLRSASNADKEDAIVAIWGPEADVATAAREVIIRAREALDGVPAETRQAYADATTGFERILPGADRMYPDTDSPPVPIDDGWVATVESGLGELPWTRLARYLELGLDRPRATRLVDAPWADLFDELAPDRGGSACRLADALEKRLAQVWRERRDHTMPAAARLLPLVRALDRGGPFVHLFESALMMVLRNPELSAEVLLAAQEGEVESALANAFDDIHAFRQQLRTDDAPAVMRWAMGQVMPIALGRVEPLEMQARLCAALELEDVAR